MTDLPNFDYTDSDRRRWNDERIRAQSEFDDRFGCAYVDEAAPDEVDRSMAVVAMVICALSGAVVGLIVGIPLGAMLAQNVARWWRLI